MNKRAALLVFFPFSQALAGTTEEQGAENIGAVTGSAQAIAVACEELIVDQEKLDGMAAPIGGLISSDLRPGGQFHDIFEAARKKGFAEIESAMREKGPVACKLMMEKFGPEGFGIVKSKKQATTVATNWFQSPTPENLLSSQEVRRLSARDLSAQTHKWDGKVIEATLSCFYADVSEYRCGGGGVRIDFVKIGPDEAARAIERNCDTLSRMDSAACRRTIRFTYDSFDTLDTGGFTGKLTVVKARDHVGAVVRAPGKRRK